MRLHTWGARKAGGEIVHELEPGEGGPPAVGDVLEVDLDWARRLYGTHPLAWRTTLDEKD